VIGGGGGGGGGGVVCGWNRVRLGRRMSKDGEASSSGWIDGWMDACRRQ